jgi:hypothetical protein
MIPFIGQYADSKEGMKQFQLKSHQLVAKNVWQI